MASVVADGPARPGLALTALVTCQLMLVIDATIVNIALPDIADGLGFSASGLSGVVNAYTLAFGGLLLLGGRVGDVFGRRRVFCIGVAGFALASLAGGLAQGPVWVLVSRAAQGAAAAFAAPGALSLLAATFPDGPLRTRAVALFTTMSAAGMAIGLTLGGVLTAWAGWRAVFFVNVPVAVAVAVMAPLAVAESARSSGRFDVSGALASMLGTSLLVWGCVRAADAGWAADSAWGSLLGGAVVLTGFVVREARAAQPILPLSVLTDRYRAGAFTQRFLVTAAMAGLLFFLTLYVQDVRGYGPLRTAVAYLPTAVTGLAAGRLAPRLITRWGVRAVVISGATLSAGGMFWIATVSPTSGYATTLLGPIMLFGAGNVLVAVAATYVALDRVPTEIAGATSASLQVSQQLGAALGVAALVAVFGSGGRHLDDPAGTAVNGFDAVFTAAGVVTVVMLFLGVAGFGAARPARGRAPVDATR